MNIKLRWFVKRDIKNNAKTNNPHPKNIIGDLLK